jgi:hypothetical protein
VNLQMCKMLSSTSPSTLLPLQCLARPIFYLQWTLYCARLSIILEPLQMDRLSAMVLLITPHSNVSLPKDKRGTRQWYHFLANFHILC